MLPLLNLDLTQMIHTENQQVYSEVDGLSVLMGFQTANAGCCKVSASKRDAHVLQRSEAFWGDLNKFSQGFGSYDF